MQQWTHVMPVSINIGTCTLYTCKQKNLLLSRRSKDALKWVDKKLLINPFDFHDDTQHCMGT